MVVQDMLDARIKIRLELSYCARLGVKNRRVASRADQLDDHKHHYLGIPDGVWCVGDYHIVNVCKINVLVVCLIGKSILENTPAEVFGDKIERCLVFDKLIDNVVYYENDLRLIVVLLARCFHLAHRLLEQLGGFVRDQPVAQIVLVLEIQIERALCNTRVADDVGDRCLVESLCGKKVERRVQQGGLLLLFVSVELAHFYQLLIEKCRFSDVKFIIKLNFQLVKM